MLRVPANPKPLISTIRGPAIVGSLLAILIILKLPIRRRNKFEMLSLPSLRRALIGLCRRQVQAMLGRPRAAQGGHPGVWYYPLNSREHLAMAISFEQELVQSVEFFKSPV